MAAYKSVSTWYEDDYGVVEDTLIVGDSYGALFDEFAAAPVTGVYVIESTKHDLDLEGGVFAADEISFTVDQMLIADDDPAAATTDALAVSFVLAAQNPGTRRFCARVIRRAGDPLANARYEMRGRIRSEMSAEDVRWSGDDYTTIRTPVRTWHITGGAYDVEHLLDADLATLMDGGTLPNGEPVDGILNDAAWLAAEVADRLGYFRETNGAIRYDYSGNAPVLVMGPKQARWGNLISLSALIQRLLADASGAAVNVLFEVSNTGMLAAPARFVPLTLSDGRNLRYCNRFTGIGRPAPYRRVVDDYYELLVGGDAVTPGSMYVSFTNLDPEESDVDISWRNRYKTLAELLYELAGSLGMYVKWDYTTATDITCRFESREALVGGACYIRDAVTAALDVKPVVTDAEEDRQYTGAAWQYTREGEDPYYIFDGLQYTPSREQDAAPSPEDGNRLPITISPTWCLLDSMGDDAGYNLGAQYGMSWIPHGAVFWSDVAREDRTDPEANPRWAAYNRAVLHSGMYIRCDGRNDDGSIGVDGMAVWAPVAGISVTIGGVRRFFTSLSEYRNTITNRDGTYFEAEYTITVPGLHMFRAAPPAAGDTQGDWTNCNLGAVVTLDGVAYVIVGIERKIRETVLRLHAQTRFAFTTPPLASYDGEPSNAARLDAPPAALSRENIIAYYNAAEAIALGQVVAVTGAGAVRRARAYHDDYGMIAGIALAAAAAGEEVPVQTSGRVPNAGHSYAPGTPLYVRTAATPTAANISSTRLSAKTATEDMHVRIGTAELNGGVLLDGPPEQYVFYPPIDA